MENDDLMPVIFVSHGSPMLALDNENGREFTLWANHLPKPRAILVFSAHWETESLAFGETASHDQLVYDFGGFPEALYEVQYPAPSADFLVDPIRQLLHDKYPLTPTNRGLDHGVWVPFLHMWPNADIPILQMTMPYTLSNRELFELGQMLSPLRAEGVLISANGTLTHNLGEWNPRFNSGTPEWAKSFDEWTKQVLLEKSTETLISWEQHAPEAKRNHPTPEHFRPLLIAAGAAQSDQVSFPIEGFDFGIFSKRSVEFG